MQPGNTRMGIEKADAWIQWCRMLLTERIACGYLQAKKKLSLD